MNPKTSRSVLQAKLLSKSSEKPLLRIIHSTPCSEQSEFCRVFDELAARLIRRRKIAKSQVVNANIIKISESTKNLP